MKVALLKFLISTVLVRWLLLFLLSFEPALSKKLLLSNMFVLLFYVPVNNYGHVETGQAS